MTKLDFPVREVCVFWQKFWLISQFVRCWLLTELSGKGWNQIGIFGGGINHHPLETNFFPPKCLEFKLFTTFVWQRCKSEKWICFAPGTLLSHQLSRTCFVVFSFLKKHVKFLVLLSKEFGGWVHFWWWSSDAGLKFANWNLLHGIWNFRVQPKIDVWQLHLFCAEYIICKEDLIQDFRIQDFLMVKYVKIHFAPIMCNSALLV